MVYKIKRIGLVVLLGLVLLGLGIKNGIADDDTATGSSSDASIPKTDFSGFSDALFMPVESAPAGQLGVLSSPDNNQQTATKTEYGSTVSITGPVKVSPNINYDIILSATTTAPIYQWYFYEDGIYITGDGFVWGNTFNRTFTFNKPAEGNHTYLLRFRGIAGAHGWPPFTEVSIAVTIAPQIQPPQPPSNLVASAVSSSQINLQWQDNSNNEQGFIIESKTSCHDPFIQIATVEANATSYSNTNLSPGTVYYYRVHAYNEAGESDYSNIALAVTFSHIATTDELIADTEYIYQAGLLRNYGIYNSVQAKLKDIQKLLDTKDYSSAIGKLKALSHEINAQLGNSIGFWAGLDLKEKVDHLISNLSVISNLPYTIDLHLIKENACSNEVVIQLPGGNTVKTSLTGNLSARFLSTSNPDVLSVTITQASYEGTPIAINGINFGVLNISQNSNNPSTGTLNINTRQIEVRHNILVASPYLSSLGISPVPMEILLKGTVSPAVLNETTARAVLTGFVPSNVPLLGDASIIILGVASNLTDADIDSMTTGIDGYVKKLDDEVAGRIKAAKEEVKSYLEQYMKEVDETKKQDVQKKLTELTGELDKLEKKFKELKEAEADKVKKKLSEITKDELENLMNDFLAFLRNLSEEKFVSGFTIQGPPKETIRGLGPIMFEAYQYRFELKDKTKFQGPIDGQGTVTVKQDKYEGKKTTTKDPERWGLSSLIILKPKAGCKGWKVIQLANIKVTYNGKDVQYIPEPQKGEKPIKNVDGWFLYNKEGDYPYSPLSVTPEGDKYAFDAPSIPKDNWNDPKTDWGKAKAKNITYTVKITTWILCLDEPKILGYLTWGYTLTIVNGEPQKPVSVVQQPVTWTKFSSDDTMYKDVYKELVEK